MFFQEWKTSIDRNILASWEKTQIHSQWFIVGFTYGLDFAFVAF